MDSMALKPDPEVSDDRRRPRLCLKCRTSFASQWAGERICARCKATNAWQSGFQVQVHAWNRASKRSSS
jgi:hypothetical protein